MKLTRKTKNRDLVPLWELPCRVCTSRWKQTFSMSRVGTPKHLILTASALFQWLWMSSNVLWVTPPFPNIEWQIAFHSIMKNTSITPFSMVKWCKSKESFYSPRDEMFNMVTERVLKFQWNKNLDSLFRKCRKKLYPNY